MKILIIFGTEGGTTRYTAGLIKKMFVQEHHSVDLFEVDHAQKQPVLEGYDLLLLGSPTYYEGQLETKIAELLSDFSPDLSQYKVSVFGLGNQGYYHFCGSADILEAWVTHNGGKVLLPALKIDGYPKEDDIQQWVKQLISSC